MTVEILALRSWLVVLVKLGRSLFTLSDVGGMTPKVVILIEIAASSAKSRAKGSINKRSWSEGIEAFAN